MGMKGMQRLVSSCGIFWPLFEFLLLLLQLLVVTG